MLKTLAMAVLTALVTACAAFTPSAASDTMRTPSGSITSGESTAAGLGFHGPVYRSNKADGPN